MEINDLMINWKPESLILINKLYRELLGMKKFNLSNDKINKNDDN
jgi:hypothetical protein